MRRTLCLCVLILGFIACRKSDIQITITYDKSPQNVFPYIAYGDVAKIHYTIGSEHFVKEVLNHHSIQLIVPEKTQMHASFEKFITDGNGTTRTGGDAYYTVDKNNPDWRF